MADSTEKRIRELADIIKIINKDNEFLRFENDNLIRQGKLQTAIIEKLQKRIENLKRLDSIVDKNIESGFINNETNSLTNENSSSSNEINLLNNERNSFNNEKSSLNNDSNSLINERNPLNNERSSLNNEKSSENNERSPENNERSPENNERSSENNERSTENTESNPLNNERSSLNNERSSENNERSSENTESNTLNNESSSENNERNSLINESSKSIDKSKESEKQQILIIRGNIEIKFKKKYINKVKERLSEEIYYFLNNDKVRVDSMLPEIGISFPTIMRDFQLLKKLKWIEHAGLREGGHYVLSEEGRKLTRRETSEVLMNLNQT